MELDQKAPKLDIDIEKENIISRIKDCGNERVIAKVKAALEEESIDEILALNDEYIQNLIYQGDDASEPCITNIKTLSQKFALDRYEDKVVFPIFLLSITMLILAGAIILLLTGGSEIGQFSTITWALFNIYAIVWLLFFADFIALIYLANKESVVIHKNELIFRVLGVIFPPLRIGSRRITNSSYIWLPVWGWSKANYALFDRLRRNFSMPMIVIALLIIPVLIVEIKFYDLVTQSFPGFNLDLWLQLTQAFIWISFTFEFILMFSVTNEKIDYCKRNWIDLLIILLPLVSFFRTLRLIRIARLNHLARGYKLRGILMKAKQGLVLADALQRIIYPNPKIQLRSLHKKLTKNKREREDIARQIIIAVERVKHQNDKK